MTSEEHPLNQNLNVLLIGESWFIFSIHQKGFDAFQTAEYQEGATHFVEGLERRGHRVEFIPSHEVAAKFPTTGDHLTKFDVVILSDVGSNTFLLTPDTFSRSVAGPNRLEILREYVLRGGGLLMIGGYMSFAGIDGKARFSASPVADVLPVTISAVDDRVEVPQGFVARIVSSEHPAVAGVPEEWPALLGYNQVVAKSDAEVLVTHGDDPIVAVGNAGSGRAAAFTSDLAPHWAPPAFVSWDGYFMLWEALLAWLAGADIPADRAAAAAQLDAV
jgi:uncharacterized membrane protein